MSEIPSMVRMIVAATLICASVAPIPGASTSAKAAEVKVLVSVALASALDELAPIFERGGDKVVLDYGLAVALSKRIAEGAPVDVAILMPPLLEDLQKQGKLAPGAIPNVGGTAVSFAVRAGAPKPDISTVDALKRTLLDAKSIVYADPAKGGGSGVYFAKVIDRLGLVEQLKAKTILVPGAQAAEVVAKGEAELGVGQASEIVPVGGAVVLGPFPGDLASVTHFSAAIGSATKTHDAAAAFIAFLTGPIAAPVLKAKGFEP
jgi:molybdate transport system substrate-binding protein